MLMTYILNTMESLEASRWHNEAFLVCIISFPESPNAMATLEVSRWHNKEVYYLHHYTPAFPNAPMQWQYWRRLAGTTKLFFVDVVVHQLSEPSSRPSLCAQQYSRIRRLVSCNFAACTVCNTSAVSPFLPIKHNWPPIDQSLHTHG
jgi:hypothetical protein